jgi:hypothetical protein
LSSCHKKSIKLLEICSFHALSWNREVMIQIVVWSACRVSVPELLSSLSPIDAVTSGRIVTSKSGWDTSCNSSHLRLSDTTALSRTALIIRGASLFSFLNLGNWGRLIANELELRAANVVWLTGNLRRHTHVGGQSSTRSISCGSVGKSTAKSRLSTSFGSCACSTSSWNNCRSCNSDSGSGRWL